MANWEPDVDVVLTDSEDDENDYFKRDFKGRQAMLFVVDAFLYQHPERFEEALKIIRGAFISGMLVNDKDLMGVMFDNTAKSPPPYEVASVENISVPENCAVFLPLRQLTKGIVEHYLRFTTTAAESFGEDYGMAENERCSSFSTMLRVCVNLADECTYKLNNVIIVYLTDQVSPHTPQSFEYLMALRKARDIQSKDVEFHVIPMVDDFNYDIFYKEFLCLVRDVELDSFVPQNAQALREMLAERKFKQDINKRSLGHFRFSLGPNLELSAQYYNYFQRRNYPRKVKLMREDNAVVRPRRVIVVRKQDEETQEILEEREIKVNEGWHEITLGDMHIRITPAQIIRVRNLHAPGMMLLGFKPKTALTENMYYAPHNFMYPDDQNIIGSKRLFRALWERCLEREKIAVCLFMRKLKSIPRYVALVPVRAVDSASGSVRSLLNGDGFKIVYLPMAKHYRHIDFADWNAIENAAPEEALDIFETIVKKLRIKYQPELINDPTLEKLQAELLALSLNIRTENDGFTDMPNASTQDERIADLIPKLDELFGADVSPAKKRGASKSSNDGNATVPVKVPKITEDDIKRLDYVQQLISSKTLTTCTAAQLRTILDEHFNVKMAKATTKQMLAERIYELGT